MAKNVTAQTGTGEVLTAEGAQVMDLIAKVGKDAYQAAVKKAWEAIDSVAGIDREIAEAMAVIETKRRGNMGRLFDLAKDCVRLTATAQGKRANLNLASALFRAACKNAEDHCVADWCKRNPEMKEKPIGQIAPSWVVLRSDFAKAMENGLNPSKHKGGTEFRTAWTEHKAKHPESKDSKGRKSDGKAAAREAGKEFTETVTKNPISENYLAVMRSLARVVVGMSIDQQNEAAEILQEAYAKVAELREPTDDEKADAAAAKAARRKAGRAHAQQTFPIPTPTTPAAQSEPAATQQ